MTRRRLVGKSYATRQDLLLRTAIANRLPGQYPTWPRHVNLDLQALRVTVDISFATEPVRGLGWRRPSRTRPVRKTSSSLVYSFRRATTGSTRDARCAGTKQARAATARRMNDTRAA